jgi:hypothetical protein
MSTAYVQRIGVLFLSMGGATQASTYQRTCAMLAEPQWCAVSTCQLQVLQLLELTGMARLPGCCLLLLLLQVRTHLWWRAG